MNPGRTRSPKPWLIAAIVLAGHGVFASPAPMTRDEIIELARTGVDYSYWWGHGRWRTDGTQHGSCSGSCPNSCTHTGSYGADCSGFAAKVWQVPDPIPVSTDAHPYYTGIFRYEEIHWDRIGKDAIKRGDHLVYRNSSNTAGHIVVYESGDPWGNSWVYEAKGCVYGIKHNLKSISSSYVAIRRHNLVEGPPPLAAEFVSQGSDAPTDPSPDAYYKVCTGQTFRFWFELRNVGSASWVDWGEDGTSWGHNVRLGVPTDTADVFTGTARISINENANYDVHPPTWSPPGPDCNDSVFCQRTVFAANGIAGTAPSAPGIYKTTWRLVDETRAWFGPEMWLSYRVVAPECGGLECGPDPVCGQSCGSCPANHSCQDGQCTCVAQCGVRQCGVDPACGQSCGSCPDDHECDSAGQCVCVAQCGERQCGPDPVCDVSCGSCPANHECDAEGQCVCVPDCTGRECGHEPLCGANCGACTQGYVCNEGTCEHAGCVANCGSRECGPDPRCQESCGLCPPDRSCSPSGQCEPFDPGKGKVYGYVVELESREEEANRHTGRPVGGAVVSQEGDPLATTDENGYYELESAPGTYRFTASFQGCEDGEADCTVEESGFTECFLPVYVKKDGEKKDMDDIVVRGGCATGETSPPGWICWIAFGIVILVRVRSRQS